MKLVIHKPTVLLILFFHVSFITLPYFSHYLICKYLILFLVALFLIFKINVLKYNKYSRINNWLYIYLIMVMISSFINRNIEIDRNVFLVAIVFSVTVVEGFLLFEYFAIKGKIKTLINTLFYLALLYCVLTDIIMIIYPSLHITNQMYYFVGNKFRVSYLHIQLIILFLQRQKYINKFMKIQKTDIIFLLLIIFSIFICMYVGCTTGLIGVILILIFNFMMRKSWCKFKNPKRFLLILFVSSSLLLLFSGIVQFEPIKYIIVDVLNEDLTLTGRLNIYRELNQMFEGHFLWGYGMGSSFEILTNMIGAPNTQNGILEVIFQQGIISFFCLIGLVWSVFKYISKGDHKNFALIMLYIYIIYSSVEITLDIPFLIWLVLALVFDDCDENIGQLVDKKE